jgi:hypothetical protein
MLLNKKEHDKMPFRRYKNQTAPTVQTCPKDGGGETAKRSTGMAAIRE